MKDKKPNNPNAFPQEIPYSPGMTSRDYFAAMAMQAILGNKELFLEVLKSQEDKTMRSSDGIALNSYAMADAMLKQREIKTDE